MRIGLSRGGLKQPWKVKLVVEASSSCLCMAFVQMWKFSELWIGIFVNKWQKAKLTSKYSTFSFNFVFCYVVMKKLKLWQFRGLGLVIGIGLIVVLNRSMSPSWHRVQCVNLGPKTSPGFFRSSLKENVNRESRKFESRDPRWLHRKKTWANHLYLLCAIVNWE